jgi:hypothetical protein
VRANSICIRPVCMQRKSKPTDKAKASVHARANTGEDSERDVWKFRRRSWVHTRTETLTRGEMIPTTTGRQKNGSLLAASRGLSVAAVTRPGVASQSPLPEIGSKHEPLPIWLAVLIATSCHARSSQGRHDVRWDCVSGRAIYTNYGRDAERIEPLGVNLQGGETLAVYWIPGETAYTFEVFSQTEKCA